MRITFTNESMLIEFTDGRLAAVPLSSYPRLLHSSPEERQHWELLGDGCAIEWPDFDEHIGIEGILAGRPSGESQRSLERWLTAR